MARRFRRGRNRHRSYGRRRRGGHKVKKTYGIRRGGIMIT